MREVEPPTSTSERRAIPAALKREVLVEAGHRCAIPTCRHTTVEIAHIVPWKKVKEHTFDNLIALCPTCHTLYDTDKKIDQKAMLIYKDNLGLLNGRYSEFERRVLQFFCDNPKKYTVELPGPSNILILYLIRDGILIKVGDSGILSNDIPTYEVYSLTDHGKDLIHDWKTVQPL